MFNNVGKLRWYNIASEKTRILSLTGGIKANFLFFRLLQICQILQNEYALF